LSTLTDRSPEASGRAPVSEWRLRRSIGWQIPAGVAVASLGIFTACLVYVFSHSPALATFAVAVSALVMLLLGYLAALFSHGCYSARYRLEPDLLAIEWLWMTEVVPLAAIDGLYSGRQLDKRVRVDGLVWPGHYLGTAAVAGLGPVKLLGTSAEPDDLLMITTPAASYALTPDDLEGFRRALIERLEALDVGKIEHPPEATTQLPRLLRLSVLRDRLALVLLASAALVLMLSYGYISARFPGLPELIILKFNQAGAPLVVGPAIDAFRMPMVGTLVLAANALIVAVLHSRQAEGGRLLAGATLFVQLVLLAAVVIVV
jgi:hypothetical protein